LQTYTIRVKKRVGSQPSPIIPLPSIDKARTFTLHGCTIACAAGRDSAIGTRSHSDPSLHLTNVPGRPSTSCATVLFQQQVPSNQLPRSEPSSSLPVAPCCRCVGTQQLLPGEMCAVVCRISHCGSRRVGCRCCIKSRPHIKLAVRLASLKLSGGSRAFPTAKFPGMCAVEPAM
jgi:hypothetical protein